SEYNDCITAQDGKTETNNCGGINGGISNGNDIVFRTYFHPTPSISKTQKTFNFNTNTMEDLSINGRHDACFALRTPVIVEAIAAIVAADFALIDKSRR
ncbi:MAG: chorismate synthase, partial [Bacteroidales bacterium]|nr:chorismate synthase [Bacteroidales bacterium]